MLAAQPRAFTIGFLLALCCIAGFIRVSGAGEYHFNPDELNHMELAGGATLSGVMERSLVETHPPLGHLVRHYWLALSQDADFGRGLSLLFGLALIPVYYGIGRKLASPQAGFCCALLVAFSNGCIAQSYLVRNYTIFLFLLSLSVYVYLGWRERHSFSRLALYMLLACLAEATHFSGILAIFCVAAIEGFSLLVRRAPLALLMTWGAANAAIAVFTLILLSPWRDLLAFTKTQMEVALQAQYLAQLPVYPLLAIDYLFFYHTNSVFALLLFAGWLLALYLAAAHVRQARFYAALGLSGLLFGWLLAFTHLYPAEGNRHGIWLLPLVLPPAGVGLSLLWKDVERRFSAPLAGALFLALGWAGYSEEARFGDLHEYMMREAVWRDYTGYLRKLGPRTLIVASRSDAFLITYPWDRNLYRFYAYPYADAQGNFTQGGLMAMADYGQAKLLFEPYAFNYTPEDLLAIVGEIGHKGMSSGIDTLVFTSTRWSRGTTLDLIRCPNLTKAVVTFPPVADLAHLPRKEADKVPAIALVVTRQDFLRELAARDGKARACLEPAT